MVEFSYDDWIDREHQAVRQSLDAAFRLRGYSSEVAIYALPSLGSEPGRLIISDQAVIGTDCVSFPAQGTAAMAVPKSHLRALLWSACRRLPICPTE